MAVPSYFPVYGTYELVTTGTSGNLPSVTTFSGTVTFTACNAIGTPIPEIDSSVLDATVMFNSVQGVFNATVGARAYTVVGGDTWSSIVASQGGQSLTVASLQAANPTVSTLTAGIALVIPAGNDGVLRSSSGVLGVQLIDNVNLGLPPGGLTYLVSYAVVGGTVSQSMKSFRFVAPGNGSTVDVNTVTRL